MLGCNNGIGGFHSILVTFERRDLRLFLWAQKMRLKCVAVCCSVLQCVAVCCSVLQCVAMCCSGLKKCASKNAVLRCNKKSGKSGCWYTKRKSGGKTPQIRPSPKQNRSESRFGRRSQECSQTWSFGLQFRLGMHFLDERGLQFYCLNIGFLEFSEYLARYGIKMDPSVMKEGTNLKRSL